MLEESLDCLAKQILQRQKGRLLPYNFGQLRNWIGGT